MKILCILTVLFCLSTQAYCATRTVSTITNLPQSSVYANSAYNRDLLRIEDYLFGDNYSKETLNSRLCRIEREFYGRCYPSMSYAQRMNNIISAYQNDNNSTMAQYYGTNRNPAQRILNRFIGQPTGFTPSIVSTPFDAYGYPSGINRSNFSNRGYRYNNFMPSTTGAGIHILD